jgi:hypothetical protein
MRKNLKGFGQGQNRYSVYDNEGIKKQNYYVLANSNSAADYKVKQRFGEYAKAGGQISTKDWEWMTEDQEVIVQPSKVKQLFASSILLSIALVVSAGLYNVFFK